MFTGIIEEIGVVKSLSKKKDMLELEVEIAKISEGVSIGDSIAVNGVCLTVTDINKDSLSFDVIRETIDKSNLKLLNVRDRVNLERPLRPSSFLSGHFVTGHIDCIGVIVGCSKTQAQTKLDIKIPPGEFSEYIIPKGSITVDGVSLTVSKQSNDTFSVYLIPHTLNITTLGTRKKGDHVNIEVDLIGKYVKNMLIAKQSNKAILTKQFLKEKGFF